MRNWDEREYFNFQKYKPYLDVFYLEIQFIQQRIYPMSFWLDISERSF